MTGGDILDLGAFRLSYGSFHVVDIASLKLKAAATNVLVGPSGSGKSTLLRQIAGLLPNMAPQPDRRVVPKATIAFQDIDAFPWLTVEQNLGLAARQDGAADAKVKAVAEKIDLADQLHHYPGQLSGGMRKRLAFGRALLSGRKLMLLDEPFASLDIRTRIAMWNLARHVVSEWEVTLLLVTHDIEEMVEISDRVLFASGPPLQIIEILDHQEGAGARANLRRRLLSLARNHDR